VIGAIAVSITDGFDPSAMSDATTRAFAEQYATDVKSTDDAVSIAELADTLQPAVSAMLRILPFAFTMTWTLVASLNLGLGIWATKTSGNLLRPGENLAAIDFPRAVGAIFVASVLVSLLGGRIGAIGGAFAGSMAALLLLAGLSVLHTITRTLSFRLPLLVIVYLFLGLAAVPLLLVGAAEPYARLRDRLKPNPPAIPPKP
jgi:hypothetical protein